MISTLYTIFLNCKREKSLSPWLTIMVRESHCKHLAFLQIGTICHPTIHKVNYKFNTSKLHIYNLGFHYILSSQLKFQSFIQILWVGLYDHYKLSSPLKIFSSKNALSCTVLTFSRKESSHLQEKLNKIEYFDKIDLIPSISFFLVWSVPINKHF